MPSSVLWSSVVSSTMHAVDIMWLCFLLHPLPCPKPLCICPWVPCPWLEVQPENPGPSVNFHLDLHTRLLPRSFQVSFFIAIVIIIWLFKFLRLRYIEWTYLGPFNVRGLVGGLIDPPDFWWSCIKTFTSVPPIDTLFISFLNNHLQISTLLEWVPWFFLSLPISC